MSLSYSQLKPVKVIDPRASVKQAKEYLFNQPGSAVTYRTFTTNSASDSSVQFSCPPPNPNIIVSRCVLFTCKINYRVTFTNVNIANANQFIGSIAPRQFPLASCINTLTVKINNDSISQNINDYIHPLTRYYATYDKSAYNLSLSPAFPDQAQSYVITNALPRNPLGDYANNGNSQPPRGSFPRTDDFQVVNDANGNARILTFSYTYTEPLFLSPLSAEYDEMGLSQLTTFDVNITWGDLARSLSIDIDSINAVNAGPQIAPQGAVSATIDANSCKLKFIYITPQVNYPLPDTLIYDFNQINRYDTSIGNIAANANGSVVTNNIQLSTIPSRAYIFVRRRNQDRTYGTADVYARINKIDMNFNGISGILSSADTIDLWRMSVNNGLKMSYEQWYGQVGSVCCIDFGHDIGLGANQGVGMLGSYNLSLTIDFTNINAAQVDYTAYVVVVNRGTYTISNQNVLQQLGVVSSEDVINSASLEEADKQELERLYGGKFDGLKNVFSKVKKAGEKVAPYAKTAAKVGATLAPELLPLLGLGYTREDIQNMLDSGTTKAQLRKMIKQKMGITSGSGLAVGGKKATKSLMDRQLSTYSRRA